MARSDARLAREVVLALVCAEPRHGWALQRELAPTGHIGRAWTLSRQLTYRAIDSLVDDGLARRAAPREGLGGDRVIISPTAAGRRHCAGWLDKPVEHLRDVRTELVVKVMLREMHGLRLEPFVARQRTVFEPLIAAVTDANDSSPVGIWREESAESVRRWLDRLSRSQAPR
ncbi:MAG: PadR family transcriptional regulator [Ilumatobacteraceae bacterium]